MRYGLPERVMIMDLARKGDRAPYAARMRHLRLHHGRTLEACAAALGVTISSYDAMERNKIRFRRRDLVTLAALYELPLEEAFPTPMCAFQA